MDPEARYTLVGASVLILAALVVAAVWWLRSTGEGRDDRQYKVYIIEQSLEGLEVRSDVRMRGIRVGTVTGFRFSSRRPDAVEVFIRVDKSAPVRQNTQAVVDRHLVTGLASIRLVNPTEASPLLTEAPEGEPYPVIAEGESVYQQLSESVNQLAARADETMQRITQTLSAENQAALAEVLANLRTLTRDADRAVVSAGGAAEEVRKLAAGVAADARKLAERYDTLGKQAGTSLTDITGEVRAMREEVSRLAERADRLMATGDVELRATARALRSAADALGETAGRLRDPGEVIYGPPAGALGPGEGGR
jgi:phospholipid/cholesterol/gamma-HCH transport system substrate-binding protein